MGDYNESKNIIIKYEKIEFKLNIDENKIIKTLKNKFYKIIKFILIFKIFKENGFHMMKNINVLSYLYNQLKMEMKIVLET